MERVYRHHSSRPDCHTRTCPSIALGSVVKVRARTSVTVRASKSDVPTAGEKASRTSEHRSGKWWRRAPPSASSPLHDPVDLRMALRRSVQVRHDADPRTVQRIGADHPSVRSADSASSITARVQRQNPSTPIWRISSATPPITGAPTAASIGDM